jgi:SPP1 family predicted phage head-tail adaptor
MDPGRMRDRVTIETPSTTADAGGDRVTTWAQLATPATVAAAVEPLSGREFTYAKSFAATVSHRVTIRYRADVTARCRLTTARGEVLAVNAAIDPERRRRWLECYCTQVVST